MDYLRYVDRAQYIVFLIELNMSEIFLFLDVLIWKYRKRRYHCHCCGKHFFEHNHLLPKWHRISSGLALYAISLLEERRSFKDIAHSLSISTTTLFRWLRFVSFPIPRGLPKILSIDEFKGNTDGNKFHCIIPL